MWNVVAYFGLLTATFLFAWWIGGAPERAVASVIALSSLLDLSINAYAPRGPAAFAVIVLDVATTLVVILVALKAERIWPMVISGLLIVGVELQVATLVAPIEQRMIYKVAHAFSAYPLLLLIGLGTWRRHRRHRQRPDLDWSAI